MTEPMATPTPVRNGTVDGPLPPSPPDGIVVNPLITRYSTQMIITGATTYRANAAIPVNPNRLLAIPTTANPTLISTTWPQPNSPSNRVASRLNANAVQPAATPISSSDTRTEPTRPKIDRVSRACVCPVEEPRYAAGSA